MALEILMALAAGPFLAWGAYAALDARSRAQSSVLARLATSPLEPVTLVRVSIAFDAGARSRLQALMDVATGRRAAPGRVVGAVAEILADEIAHAKMFALGTTRVFGQARARELFDLEVARQRERYGTDGPFGPTRQSTRPFRDGGGYVVATLYVARTVDVVFRAATGATLGDLCVVLKVLCSARPEDTLGAECAWVPADPQRVMSLVEMTEAFPELVPVAEGVSNGDFCRTFCPFCGRAHSADAQSCPYCNRVSVA
jgi:hypothetical protein